MHYLSIRPFALTKHQRQYLEAREDERRRESENQMKTASASVQIQETESDPDPDLGLFDEGFLASFLSLKDGGPQESVIGGKEDDLAAEQDGGTNGNDGDVRPKGLALASEVRLKFAWSVPHHMVCTSTVSYQSRPGQRMHQ